MGRILQILATIFVVLKLVGVIDWEWWQVLLPFYIYVAGIVIEVAIIVAIWWRQLR